MWVIPEDSGEPTKGYAAVHSPKMVFVKPMISNARELLSGVRLDYHTGGSKIMLSADHMQSLPSFFADIPDPRRAQGTRHRLTAVLAVAAATLCGRRGYKAMANWARHLSQNARRRFGCRYENGRWDVPSESIIRDVLIRVDPAHLDSALQRWNEVYGKKDKSLAIDGKTMCNAVDEQGRQVHIMSVIGHETNICSTQQKVGVLPIGDDALKQTNEIKTAIPLLDAIDIKKKDITTDALLTQRTIADYIVVHAAHYHFTVKGNQPTLFDDIKTFFKDRGIRPITENLKQEKYGPPPKSTAISIFPM